MFYHCIFVLTCFGLLCPTKRIENRTGIGDDLNGRVVVPLETLSMRVMSSGRRFS